MRSLPIGVFDSGLGGLSILSDLARRLPHEDFVYLGDVARLPYGTKSPDVVERYARTCLSFLQSRGVKLIVIACNTATAAALETLRSEFSVGVFGVIESGVKAALQTGGGQRVLVLGTRATVASESYPREFRRQAPDTRVTQLACPLLVPLAEEGWFDHALTASVITAYFQELSEPPPSVVLLGCTHYPLLDPSFRRVLSPEVRLVHGGPALAEEIASYLTQQQLHTLNERLGKSELFATDYVSSAVPIVAANLGKSAVFERVDL